MNSGSQDMPMEQMPPMDMQPNMGGNMGGNFMPQGDMQQMPMDDGMGGMPNEFDTNFDPGVEADEEQDPKKFIQQLTGKLSQSLQKYNDNNGQPDIDLNKYVAGMIVKQAVKGLSQEDTDEIIDKVKSDEDIAPEGDMQQMPNDNQQMPQGDMQQMPTESLNRNTMANDIKEIVNGILDHNKEEDVKQEIPQSNKGYRTSAYKSPNFKK